MSARRLPRAAPRLAAIATSAATGAAVPAAAIAAILLAAAGLRLWLALGTSYPGFDAVYYLHQARTLVSTGVLPFGSFAPGWPLLVSAGLLPVGAEDPLTVLRVAQVLNVVLGTALVGLTFVMLRRHAGTGMGLLGAAMMAVQPLAVRLSTGAMSDLLAAVLLAGAWLLLARGAHVRAGLCLGYAYVVRPELLLVAGAVALAELVRTRRIPWRLGLAAAACVVPYLVFARLASGQWTLSGKSGFLAAGLADVQQRGLGAVLGENLPELLSGLPAQLGWPLVILALVGVMVRPGRHLLFMLPVLVLPIFTFRMDARYWVPYLPFWLLAASHGGMWLAGIAARGAARMGWAERPGPERGPDGTGAERPRPAGGPEGPRAERSRPAGGPDEARAGSELRQTVAAALAAMAVVGFAMTTAPEIRRLPQPEEVFLGLRDAGLWLRERVDRHTVVAGYKPYASYWAGCRFAGYGSAAGAGEVLTRSVERGAEYLVVNRYVARFLMPDLAPFFDPLPPHVLEVITPDRTFTYPDLPGQETRVFRVNAPVPPAPGAASRFWVP